MVAARRRRRARQRRMPSPRTAAASSINSATVSVSRAALSACRAASNAAAFASRAAASAAALFSRRRRIAASSASKARRADFCLFSAPSAIRACNDLVSALKREAASFLAASLASSSAGVSARCSRPAARAEAGEAAGCCATELKRCTIFSFSNANSAVHRLRGVATACCGSGLLGFVTPPESPRAATDWSLWCSQASASGGGLLVAHPISTHSGSEEGVEDQQR